MSLLFKNADVLATKDGKFEFMKNVYLGVDNGKIDYLGKEKPSKHYDEEKSMENKIILPGLNNCHGHSAMNIMRGLGSDLPLQDWLHLLWPIEDVMTGDDFFWGMEMAILEMLACGTTSFCDMYMMPQITQKCIEESGIKANLTRVMLGGDKDTDYLTYPRRVEALDFYKNYNGAFNDRLHVDWSIHAEYTIDPVLCQKWADEISSIGGRVHIHVSETKLEHEQCIQKYGKTPVKFLADMGFFNIPAYLAHCVWVTEEDMDIMKEYGVSPVHNPSSNMKLGSGFAPVPRMIEKGLNVALGTDGSASNNNVNMFEEMHLASIIHNGYTNNPVIMNPQTVLKMATVNGSKLQGREDTGSIEVGKKADLIAIDTDKPHLVPNLNPTALLVYSAQGSDVCMTMVDGKILYENGNFLTLDRDRIFHNYKKSVDHLFG